MSARGDGNGGDVQAGIDCPRSSLLNARKAVETKRLGWSVMIGLLDRECSALRFGRRRA